MKVPDGELKNCVLITSDLCRFKHAYCEINHICLMLRKKYTNRINNALRISSSLVYNNTITSYNTEVKKKKKKKTSVHFFWICGWQPWARHVAEYGDARPWKEGQLPTHLDNYLPSLAYTVFRPTWLKYRPANGKGWARSSDNCNLPGERARKLDFKYQARKSLGHQPILIKNKHAFSKEEQSFHLRICLLKL